MVMNFGVGYPGSMGMTNNYGTRQTGSVNQYYLNKYGCEDCFRKQPYWTEYPKPVTPEPKTQYELSFFKKLCRNIFGI